MHRKCFLFIICLEFFIQKLSFEIDDVFFFFSFSLVPTFFIIPDAIIPRRTCHRLDDLSFPNKYPCNKPCTHSFIPALVILLGGGGLREPVRNVLQGAAHALLLGMVQGQADTDTAFVHHHFRQLRQCNILNKYSVLSLVNMKIVE